MTRRPNQARKQPHEDWKPLQLEEILDDPEHLSSFEWRGLPGLVLIAPPDETIKQAHYRHQNNQLIYDEAVERWNTRMRGGGLQTAASTPVHAPAAAPPRVPTPAAPSRVSTPAAPSRVPTPVQPAPVTTAQISADTSNARGVKRPRVEVSLNDNEVRARYQSLALNG
jgi:hypothetical protein